MSQKKKRIVQPPAATILPMESFQPAFNRSAIMGAMLCSAVAMSPAVSAQDQQTNGTTRELDTVVVTGSQTPDVPSHKFTAPLLDTPRSITIIDEEMMKERGATSLLDVLRTTPGITLGAGEGGTPLGDRPFVRGFEAANDIQIDGMRDLGRASHESFNLESVAIHKGPGSAYSGAGSTGGSINLVSKTAKAEDFSTATLTLGTDSLLRSTLDVNHYEQEQDLALRVNFMKHESDVAGRDVAENNRWGFAPTLTWGLSGPTRVTLSYYHLQTDDIPDQGVPVSEITNKPVDVDRNNFYGRADRDYRETSADIATLTLEHDFSNGFTLRNSLRSAETVQDYIMGRPVFNTAGRGQPSNGVQNEQNGIVGNDWRSRYVENSSLINQTDLFGQLELGGMTHNIAAGLEISRETIENINKLTGSAGPNDLHNPNPWAQDWEVKPGNGQTASKYQTDVVAVYVFDTINLHEQWDLNLGLRYDDYQVENRVPNGAESDSQMLNWQTGVVFKPVPNGSIYLSYATSSNPSGENTQSGNADGAGAGNLNNGKNELDPEENRSIELGTKWELFNGQLNLTAAVFHTEKTNARVIDPNTDEVALAGNQEVTGIELEVNGNITENWSITAGYTYLDAEVVDAGGDGANNGNQAKFIAPHSLSLWTSYSITDRWTAGIGANYMDERYMNDDNTITVDDYWRVDAMTAFRVSENFDLQLNVLNLTDETIYDASHVGLFATVAPGRSAELTATYRF